MGQKNKISRRKDSQIQFFLRTFWYYVVISPFGPKVMLKRFILTFSSRGIIITTWYLTYHNPDEESDGREGSWCLENS
jgi:hypothetical protein